MSLFDAIRKLLTRSNPLEERIREIVATERPLDAVMVFQCVSPLPAFQSITEWRCRGASCEQTWIHTERNKCIDQGKSALPAADALALIARLHDLVASKQCRSESVKDGAHYAAAWKRGDQSIETFFVNGLIEQGPFQDFLKDLQAHIPFWRRPGSENPGKA
jgi:hypothetical protein